MRQLCGGLKSICRIHENGRSFGNPKAYNELLVNCGREVRVLEPKGEWQAEALGINDGGELLVRKVDGSETAVYAGEVSVRGIYGYV